ncbi:MAG TPA: GyrI-like domain-containing protein [Anaerolineales bacterium]|mgnify:CR=1 FL=1|nr:GyrI-like domain-containing protein [Anaerolineales bacterium]HRQ92694.1 GyrI-like domain-containing protein [Anaerolineales bacterium]
MDKLDLKKEYKQLYNPSAKHITLVSVPRFNFIMIDGEVPPNIKVDDAPEYIAAVEALFSLSYTLKFMCKKRKVDPIDYAVMPLEGLWWSASSSKEFTPSRANTWHFTMMILQPPVVTKTLFAEGVEAVRAKKAPAVLDAARFESFEESKAVQTLHLGPYSEEPATIARMVAFSDEQGLKPNGKHHEIYLSDPRRTAQAKLKTILRHPVK